MNKTLKSSLLSLLLNVCFSAYHIILGHLSHSWWLLTIGVYYTILGIVRFILLQTKKRENLAAKITGIMLIMLSVTLVGTVILSVVRDRGKEMHEIVMIAIAVYAFSKITIATINLIKSRRATSPKLIALRNISFADGFASIFALQRSMLVSFDGMSDIEIKIMNIATGSAVCIFVFLLGLNLLQKNKLFFKYQEPKD